VSGARDKRPRRSAGTSSTPDDARRAPPKAGRRASALPAGVAIREAGAGDEAAVVRLVVEMGRDFAHGTTIDEAFVRRYLEQPGARILLAVGPEGPVGVLSYSVTLDLYHAAPAGEIEDVAVTAPARGNGVGEALVREAMRRLVAEGCAEIGVITSRDNRRAQRVYRRAGLTDELVCLQRHLVDEQ
jgi:ribosomal protein S18 acetylase RimI-like enzyme